MADNRKSMNFPVFWSATEGTSHIRPIVGAAVSYGEEERTKKRKLKDTNTGDGTKLRKIDDDEVCNYCMQDMKVEQDPRKLPCGHVFCLTCLMDDCTSKGIGSHQCITCKREYRQMDFNSLPTLQTTVEFIQASTSPTLYCDRCLDKPAVRYCVDCGVKSCATHMEHHDGFFEGLHKSLDIIKYSENPSVYNKAITCEHHKECITMACKICYQYNCLQCCEQKTHCEGYGRDHIFLPLATIEKEIKQTFDNLMKQISEKLTKIEGFDKQAWTTHDELLVKCKEMTAEVERKSKAQIEQIKTQSEQLKKSIQQYKAETVDKVVNLSTELMRKREEIEEVRKSTHKFLRSKHVTELIKVKQETIELLTRTNNIYVRGPDWAEQKLRTGKKQNLEMELTAYGQSQHSSSVETPFFARHMYNRWNP